jgi:predicted amidophosphoribosyltransferase
MTSDARRVDANSLVRDALELLFVVAVGGMLFSAVRKLRAGQIHVVRCPACDRPTSNAYPRCKHCGAPLP